MSLWMRLSLMISFAFISPALFAQGVPKPPLVLAASSLQEALTAVAGNWAKQGHPKPILSFGASSALARQIEAGGPADIYISADEKWMDDVGAKGIIDPKMRRDLLGNELLLIAPLGSKARLNIVPHFAIAAALGEQKLAIADPDSVPAGIYGKASLQYYGVWNSVANKIARTENVRAALALVERGEVPFGIVYATDARASSKVRVVGVFPAISHPPIIYPVALLKASTSPDASAFIRYLSSKQAKIIFKHYGFTTR